MIDPQGAETMTYPSQPGYPASPYGQPMPPGRQQNTLWLVGGTVILVLIILMTVVLLAVQNSRDSNSADDDGGGSDDADISDDYETSDMGAVEFKSESCEEFDVSGFEDATGDTISPDSISSSSSSYSSYDNVSCSYYTSTDYYSLYMYFYDYESAEDVLNYIEYDEESYGADSDYEYSEYTELGDAGSLYSNVADPTYQSTYLHVALGSLEVLISATYDATTVDKDAVVGALEQILQQSDVLYADYQ